MRSDECSGKNGFISNLPLLILLPLRISKHISTDHEGCVGRCCIIRYWPIGGAVSLCFVHRAHSGSVPSRSRVPSPTLLSFTTRKDTKKDDWCQCRCERVTVLDARLSELVLLADLLIWSVAQVDHLPHWSAEPRTSASASVGKTATHTMKWFMSVHQFTSMNFT